MIEYIVQGLKLYYGLDWLSLILGLVGLWMISVKNKNGFILQSVSVALAGIVAYMAQQYAFVVNSLISASILLYGYHNWSKDENEKIE